MKRVELETIYKARKRPVGGLNDASIIDGEMLVNEYLITISSDISDKLLSPFGRTLADLDDPLLPYEYNVPYTPTGEVTAGSFVVGTAYTILTVGTTNFMLIGASANTIGVSFIATGRGSGTVTVTYSELEDCVLFRCIWPVRLDYSVTPAVYVDSKTFDQSNIPLIQRAIEDTMISFAVYNWMMDNNIPDWQRYELNHLNKYDNLRGLTTRRINLKRTYKLY